MISPAGFVGRLVASRRAVATVELALLAPVLMALIFGIVVYGTYFASWVAVAEAASEGARASLAGMSGGERQSLANQRVGQIVAAYSPLLSSAAMAVNFPAPPQPNLFSVQLSYDFAQSNFAGLAAFVPLPVTRPTITVTVSYGGY